jgi:undecaprenyl-diphosphatase
VTTPPATLRAPNTRSHRWQLGPAAALIVFVWLAIRVALGESFAFDQSIRSAVHSRAWPPFTVVMRAATGLGSEFCLVPLAAILVWWWVTTGQRRTAILFVSAVLSAELFVQLCKLFFHRPRPEVFFGLAPAETYSFPSGHAFVPTVFFGILAAILTARVPSRGGRMAIWVLTATLSLAIGFSRIYLGFHYPSDVLGGYLAATVWLVVASHCRSPRGLPCLISS